MKKRFPAIILALCLCMGLAVPAFASIKANPIVFSGSSNSVSTTTVTYKLKQFEQNSSGAYVYAGTLAEGTDSVTILPEGTGVKVSGLSYKYPLDIVTFYAYSDPDGDGVYEQRVFSTASSESEYKVVPLTEKGPHTSTDSITYTTFGVSLMYGFDKESGYLIPDANGTTYDITFPADKLRELFGPNTLIALDVVTMSSYASKSTWLVMIPAEEDEAPAPTPAPKFTDVPAWCADAVDWAVAQKVTEGRGGGLFAPADQCKNSEILTFLWRAAKRPTVEAKADIANTPEGCFYYDAAQWANDLGLIDPGAFDPNGLCTRAQAMTFICMAFGVPYDGDEAAKAAQRFSDVDASATYAYAVAWALENGVTNGFGDEFRPDEVCSRGQIVTFLQRAYVEEARLPAEK